MLKLGGVMLYEREGKAQWMPVILTCGWTITGLMTLRWADCGRV